MSFCWQYGWESAGYWYAELFIDDDFDQPFILIESNYRCVLTVRMWMTERRLML